MFGRAELSPVVASPGRGRLFAFVLALLMVVGGLGYTWLHNRADPGTHAISTPTAASKTKSGALPTAPVMDEAGVLSEQTEAQLGTKLIALKAEIGPEMTVLTVADLGGRTIEEYALSRANRMGLGDRERDDGVLLLIAPNQHQVRIEVGLGLTTVLSNQACQRIIQQMLPLFRAGQIDAAASVGVDGVIDDLRQLKQMLPRKAA